MSTWLQEESNDNDGSSRVNWCCFGNLWCGKVCGAHIGRPLYFTPGQLFNILRIYGVGGTAMQIIKSYLTDRNQMLSVKSAKSQLLPMKFGVPQPPGLCHWPCPFSGDYERHGPAGISTVVYGHDTTIYLSGVTLEDAILGALGALHTFS